MPRRWFYISLLILLSWVWYRMRSLEETFLYFPEREFLATPDSVGLDYQDQFFQTSSGRKLHGWFIPHSQTKVTFLFFHGNAGNISHRLEKLKIFHDMGVSTFIIDYSGYGQSEGKPSEENLYEDGEASFNYAIQNLNLDPKKLFLYGESLGSAVAIELAIQKEVAGIILEGAFTTLKDLARNHMPFLALLAKTQYNNLEKIAQVQVPILFIHAKLDEISPFEQALQLYQKSPSRKEHLWLEEGGHNDAFWLGRKAYAKALQTFYERHTDPN